MSQVTVTTTTITHPVTVVFSIASPITMTILRDPSSVGLPTSGQHDVVLPLQVILWDTVRGSIGLSTMPQQQPQSQTPFYVYANLPWVLHR